MAASSRATTARGSSLPAFSCALVAVVLAALEESVGREPAAYLLPGSAPSLALTRSVALLGAAFAATLAWRRHAGFRALSWGISGLASSLSLSAAAWFLSFGQAHVAALTLVLPLSSAVACGVIAGAAAREVSPSAQELGVVPYAVHPFRVLAALVLLVGCAALGARLGAWRSAALLGVLGSGLALVLPHVRRQLYGGKSSPWATLTGLSALALSLASAALAHWALPSAALGRYPGEIVFASPGPAHYVVSSVQQSFEVYRGNVLHLASVDAKRYAECLVQPALALAPRRGSVLVLGSADGLAEREVLAYPDVARVTTVTDDLALAHLAKNNAFFRAASADALRSPRVSLVEAEALVWLSAEATRFDVIVVDLPDPSDYIQGKNYTRYFFEQLRLHLAPGGVFVTQATSPVTSPRSFSSIVQSVASAGFHVQSYAAAVPTLGEWAFVLGSLDEPTATATLSPLARRVLAQNSYVTPRRLELLLSAPPARDLQAPINTLSEQPVVELLKQERHARSW